MYLINGSIRWRRSIPLDSVCATFWRHWSWSPPFIVSAWFCDKFCLIVPHVVNLYAGSIVLFTWTSFYGSHTHIICSLKLFSKILKSLSFRSTYDFHRSIMTRFLTISSFFQKNEQLLTPLEVKSSLLSSVPHFVLQFENFQKVAIKPSLVRNGKTTSSYCGLSVSTADLSRHIKSCNRSTKTCTQCLNYFCKAQKELNHHIATKVAVSYPAVRTKCTYCEKELFNQCSCRTNYQNFKAVTSSRR